MAGIRQIDVDTTMEAAASPIPENRHPQKQVWSPGTVESEGSS